jgi:UDP-glucose 4-epimerase
LLAPTIGELCGRTPEIQFAAPRAGDIRTSLGDARYALEVLGFAARVSLRDGLAQTLASDARSSKI